MRTSAVVGYAYEAALHCPNCAEKRFGAGKKPDENGVDEYAVDREGNTISPVFAGDEPGECGDYCDDCHEPLDNMPDDWDSYCLDAFIEANKQDMFEDLSAIVADLKRCMTERPDECTEHGADEPSLDIRLCIDINHSSADGTWIFRTGDSSYDQRHSEYCAALSVQLDTNPAGLLADLIDQIRE